MCPSIVHILLVVCNLLTIMVAGSTSESEGEPEETEEERLNKQKQKVFKVAQEIMTSEEEFYDKLVLLNIVSCENNRLMKTCV